MNGARSITSEVLLVRGSQGSEDVVSLWRAVVEGDTARETVSLRLGF
jgi:hypothetical protein